MKPCCKKRMKEAGAALAQASVTHHREITALVEARRQFAQAAKRAGFSAVQIGRALNRHHTSVLHLLKK